MTDPVREILAGLRQGDPARSAALLRASLPGLDAGACRSLAFAYLTARRPGEAAAIAERGLAVAPGDCDLLSACAYAHALAGRYGPAITAAEAALVAPPTSLPAVQALATALTLCLRPRSAYDLLRTALAANPSAPDLQFNLAAVARFIGQEGDAEAAYDAVIGLQPERWDAYRNRSELRPQTQGSNHVAELTALAARATAPAAQIQLSYALSKELEDLGRRDEAFQWLERGAHLRRQGMSYDIDRDIASVDALIGAFDAHFCAGVAPAPVGDGGPIFIVGMPRTGSTLLDRMLGAHPDIQSLDELQSFGLELVAALRARAASGAKSDAITASLAIDAQGLGQAYLSAVAPLRGEQRFFIDKLPLNYLYVGLIAKALPQARIICAWRDPLDTCLGVYRTLFDEAYPFSYDQTELGRYFCAYRRLMSHWRRMLPGRVQVVAYEALTTDPEATLAAVLGPMALQLHPACLTPEANPNPVLTASASQVRAPVHRRSVGLAQAYLGKLGPLSAALEAGGALSGDLP
ncbi:MAG: sulfotransferase [Hydrogenophaga sp.]|nr:sulfotransferase [Hydrogenophaga sp.]